MLACSISPTANFKVTWGSVQVDLLTHPYHDEGVSQLQPEVVGAVAATMIMKFS